MTRQTLIISILVLAIIAGGCKTSTDDSSNVPPTPAKPKEVMRWHTVTLTFDGPMTSETATPNPFLDYRLNVTFTHGDREFIVPGYYAADGKAGNTASASGNKWRVNFIPDREGLWTYRASFRGGINIAVSTDPNVGVALGPDGVGGTFLVKPTDKVGPDFRAKGLLQYTGHRYLRFAGNGEYFIKGGADSPENFLGYAEFDDTYDSADLKRQGEAAGDVFIHHYEPHVQDWRPGDPTWRDGKGKGIIGALNYLASKGMNSVYFLTYNIDGGDGGDVWPWINPTTKIRFDCSKLDQWDIVFSHMDKLGLMLHVVTQETENDQGINGGDLGRERMLYYRELIARFGHHLALVWNLGEENTNTDAQRKAFAKFIRDVDPYDHPIVCHTFPGKYDDVYEPLLGYPYFEGPSLQTNDTRAQTLKWIDRSEAAGRPWFVCLDEIGPANTGVKPDNDDYRHDTVRRKHLWANLMAGGAGVEWYFGYNFAHNDLNCESWRSREQMWNLTRYALDFFHGYLPYAKMSHHDELTSADDDYCLAQPGDSYAIYLPSGGSTDLDLDSTTAAFTIRWYDPRRGGPMRIGSAALATGPGTINIGQAPDSTDKDWVVLVQRARRERITDQP